MDIFKYLEKIGYNNTTDQFEHHIIEYAKSENIPYLSPEKGKFLSFITKLKNPFKCLEIGLGSGYSTYKILKSLGKNGKLISIDFNFFRVELFYENIFKKLPKSLQKKISVYPLESFYVLDKLIETNEKFDFIFLDATKRDYFNYYKILPDILNNKGILIVDNITYSKQTFHLETKRSKNYIEGIKLIEKANKYLLGMDNFETVFLPVGDGISISIKLQD